MAVLVISYRSGCDLPRLCLQASEKLRGSGLDRRLYVSFLRTVRLYIREINSELVIHRRLMLKSKMFLCDKRLQRVDFSSRQVWSGFQEPRDFNGTDDLARSVWLECVRSLYSLFVWAFSSNNNQLIEITELTMSVQRCETWYGRVSGWGYTGHDSSECQAQARTRGS